MDDRGRVRLSNVRDRFFNIKSSEIPNLCDIFEFWKNQKEYFVLLERDPITFEKKGCFALKCSKRGNDKYNSKLRHKFDGLKNINKKGVFAKFFTITTDIKKYNSIEEAWLDLGRRFNRFNSYLKKFYNDRFLGFVRVFEAFKSGYPHVHGILFFSKRTYLKDFKFRKTVGAFVKFKNIRSIDGSLGYIGKYLTGGSEKKKSNLRFTQALLWLFKKRSFSFSHSLRNLIHDLHNSNHQLDLFGNVVVSEWLFIGVFLPSELVFEEGFNGNQWIYRLKEVPDPPSKDFNFDYN